MSALFAKTKQILSFILFILIKLGDLVLVFVLVFLAPGILFEKDQDVTKEGIVRGSWPKRLMDKIRRKS